MKAKILSQSLTNNDIINLPEMEEEDYKKLALILPDAFAVARRGELLYCSAAFAESFADGCAAMPEGIDTYMPVQSFKSGGVSYTVVSQLVNAEKEHILYIFRPADDSCAVGLIIIDNYDEVMQSAGEETRALLSAVVNRKLNLMARGIDGVIKSFEKDKFLLVLSEKKLEILKKNHFEILKEIREVDFGNKLPLTLTIGIGTGGDSLYNNMELARAAIDLALGRGGDQALIKSPENYTFFGGVAQEVSANTRVRARVKAFALSEIMAESGEIIVLGHKRMDLDCFGAAVGVCIMARALGRDCYISIDELSPSLTLLYNRIVAEKEYHSVFINSDAAKIRLNPQTLLVVVDVHRPSLVEARGLLESGVTKNIVVIDHHRRSAEYIENTVMTYHEPYASSTCELITEMLQYMKEEITLLPVEADALLSGISVDTKNFIAKTGFRTFEAAAYLKRNGADSSRVRLLMQNSLKNYKLRSRAVNSAEILHGIIALSICDGDNVITAQSADQLLDITGIRASFVMCIESNGGINLSARSLGDINVQVIAEKLGGGGHQTVAGAQFFGVTMAEAREKVISAIEVYLNDN